MSEANIIKRMQIGTKVRTHLKDMTHTLMQITFLHKKKTILDGEKAKYLLFQLW